MDKRSSNGMVIVSPELAVGHRIVERFRAEIKSRHYDKLSAALNDVYSAIRKHGMDHHETRRAAEIYNKLASPPDLRLEYPLNMHQIELGIQFYSEHARALKRI